jgi:hypothetical protein
MQFIVQTQRVKSTKKLLFTILVLEQLRAARDKKWSFPALPPTVPVSNIMRRTTFSLHGLIILQRRFKLPELHMLHS